MPPHLTPVALIAPVSGGWTTTTTMAAWWSTTRPSLPIALGIAVVIAIAAWRNQSLRPSGALAAMLIGTLALRAGWPWGGYLIVWFAVATVGSRLGRARKEARTAGVVEKGAQRDARQVLANGGVFALAAALTLLTDNRASSTALWGAASLAAAGADTMATEIGTWLGGTPRSVRTWRTVPSGTSGAVSLAGSTAMLGSALLLTSVAVALGLVPAARWWFVTVAAVFGALVDTAIGALVQTQRWCPSCHTATEQRQHCCGTDTRHLRGWRWLGNDAVNFVCTVSAAALAWLLAQAVAA